MSDLKYISILSGDFHLIETVNFNMYCVKNSWAIDEYAIVMGLEYKISDSYRNGDE